MAAELNKQIAREFIEGAWNRQDLSVIDQYIAPDHTSEGPMTDQFPQGPEGQKVFISTFINAFPDVHATIERQEVDGDQVTTWITFRGTQTGDLMDIPATGRRVAVQVVTTDQIADGQIIASWAEWDPNDMLRQLGVG